MQDNHCFCLPANRLLPLPEGLFCNHFLLLTGQLAGFTQKTAYPEPTICVLTNF